MLSQPQELSSYSTVNSESEPRVSRFPAVIGAVTGVSMFVLTSFSLTQPIWMTQSFRDEALTQYLPSKWGQADLVTARLVAISSRQVDTTAAVLEKLEALGSTHSVVSSHIDDARKFASSMPRDLAMPQIWTDGETEVVLEWISGTKHAVVTFEGDGYYGYALRQGDLFVPGEVIGEIGGLPPNDLFKYLA